MAISYVGVGSPPITASQTSVVVNLPSGRAAGDMLVIFIGGKSYLATISTPIGWTSLGTSTNGTTAPNTDTGSTKIQAFYRIADGTELSTISFTIGGGTGSQNVFLGFCHAYRKTAPQWNTPVGTGAINVGTTGWSTINSTSTLSLPVGCFLPTMFVTSNDITTIGLFPTYSAALRTFSGGTSTGPSFVSNLGGDAGTVSYYTSVSAATNTTPVTLNISTTGSSSDRGHAFIVQLTEAAPTTKGNFFPFF